MIRLNKTNANLIIYVTKHNFFCIFIQINKMKTTTFFIILIFFIFSCQNKGVKTVPVKNIVLDHIDIYPQHPGCKEYFEKNKQLACLSRRINNLIQHDIEKYYQKEFRKFDDTLWVFFKIDTLGYIHYINIKKKDTIYHSNRYAQIFHQIVLHIPKMKPAIYHDRTVEFEFKIPIVHQIKTKNTQK